MGEPRQEAEAVLDLGARNREAGRRETKDFFRAFFLSDFSFLRSKEQLEQRSDYGGKA